MRSGDFANIMEGQARPSKRKTKKKTLKLGDQDTGMPLEIMMEENIPKVAGQIPESPRSENESLEIELVQLSNDKILNVPKEFFMHMIATLKAMQDALT
ncbi:hypothetical protein R1flu_013070 [Riccia fluitans]|uniref:Uncharacterized protein n=1 Tax=Riccia fluitans TaxID=41844 RepID=A0ABD1ZDN9_9MARC